MWMEKVVTLLILAVSGVVLGAEKDVLELSDDDFESVLGEHETVLVMFYAPWCGHCKRLKPEYAKAAESLLENDPAIHLAKVDCTEVGKETCNKFSVSGYPTLKIFRNGELLKDYKGPREAAGIVKYMRSQVGPASKEIKSLSDLEKFLDSKETTIFGYFEKDSPLKDVFTKYSDKMRERYRFGHSSAKEVLDKKGEKNTIVLIRPAHLVNKFEDSIVKFAGSSEADLSTFISDNYHGLAGHRTQETVSDFKKPLIVGYYSIDYAKNMKGTNYWRNRILKVAKDFAGKINFAISSKDEFQHELNEYGYDYTDDSQPVMLARDEKNLKYILKEKFSVDNLKDFAQQLLDGELEPYVKSEAIPESNSDPVKVAVGLNFQDVVINNDKDTLIEFFAPWCGHCKKLAPIYDELATKLTDEDVVIVKMDATANDVPPEFNVQGFPTLFWLPKNAKNKPVPYNDGRELDDFIKYIAKHATSELKGYDRDGKPKKDEL